MLILILLGCLLSASTIAIHAMGSVLAIRFLRRFRPLDSRQVGLGEMLMILSTAGVALLLLHFVEAALWALAYMKMADPAEMDSFSDAFYFSIVTFTSLGYGDIVIASDSRLLCGIEAMNGLLIFGWSTALFFAVLQNVWSRYDHSESDSSPGSMTSTDPR